MKNKSYLIISSETGIEYRRKTIKTHYKNIKSGQIYRIYEIRRNVGHITNGKVYKHTKTKEK